MEAEVGNAAGVIWKYLEQHGGASLAKVKHETKLSEQLLLMGCGWLAREAKLEFVRDRRGFRISLKGH